MKYKEITGAIIGCAMEVHRRLGNGFPEIIYHRALAIEMELAGLNFLQEMDMDIQYRGRKIGTRRVDFYVEDKILVELKAHKELDDADLAQGLNYLEAFKSDIGLLINFGAPSLEYKRLHNNKLYRPDLP